MGIPTFNYTALSLFSPFRFFWPFGLFRLFGLLRLSRLRLCLCFSLCLCFCLSLSFAQTCQDASVELSAQVQNNPPRVTINWTANAGASQHYVYRKLKNSSSWGAVIGTLAGSDTQFIDSTVSASISYEYRVSRTAASYNGFGYINAGIEIPAVENRGILILVVDDKFVDSLHTEIERLKSDLEGDGWKVVQHNVSRTQTVTSVKALIVGTYNLDKVNTKAVFLLGHVRVPYSGDIFPDGHPDHEGAWPADVYYADINGTWTDNLVNVTVATDERHRNVPEDGKFDQSILPGDVELQIGRVDFANMPAFAASEQELLRNYLNKDHAYRHKHFTTTHRGVVDDNFGYFGNEAFAASGWKNFGPLVGNTNIIANDYFNTTRDSSYLWSYGCGGGSYVSAGGIGSTNDFAVSGLQSVFTMLFGSYFGDWDATNNFLRAPLAQGKTLTSAWSGRPHWQFHHMGLGENIGYSTRLTQNNNTLYFSSYGARFVHLALMGDPTLRNHVVAPASEVVATKTGNDAEITWTPSTDVVLGYNVYVKSELNPEYEKLNEELITSSSYTHTCLFDQGVYTYMVRAVVLQPSPSGTYYNLSQGMTGTLINSNSLNVQAEASYQLIGSEVSFTNLSLNATTYEWIFGDGQSSTEANPVHTYLDGAFTAMLIAGNGCDLDTFLIDILILTGKEILVEDPAVIVSPNPSTGFLNLSWTDVEAESMDVKVYNVSGVKVFEQRDILNNASLDFSLLSEGVYVLQYVAGDRVGLKRIVMQR